MSAEEWIEKRDNEFGTTWTEDISDLSYAFDQYANYVTQWHLNNAKEFVWNDFDIDKQSIHTAIDNYIEINLNKEL